MDQKVKTFPSLTYFFKDTLNNHFEILAYKRMLSIFAEYFITKYYNRDQGAF